MPSPFPGMDPFIESHSWPNFHSRFIIEVSNLLVPLLRPRYEVQAEERVTLEYEIDGEGSRQIVPDLVISDSQPWRSYGGAATAVAVEPVRITLPMPEEVKDRYLTIRKVGTFDIVTIIEVLSPANKRAGSDDRSAYLAKREEVLRSGVHLVELDLLRGGRRLPSVEPLPLADFFAIISRKGERPNATAYPWSLYQPMPTIPIPLADGDPDIALDLQAAFSLVYDRAGYDYTLDYSREVEPVLTNGDLVWVEEVLKTRAAASHG